nr:cytochrome P450 [Nocardia abscessus]
MSTHTAVGRPVQRAWPIVGHGLALRSRPLEFFAELHRTPEPLARIRLGSKDVYLVTAPELIDRSADTDTASSGRLDAASDDLD